MHVRFAPKADKRADVSLCPLSAKSGLMQCSKDLVIRQSDPWKPGHAHSRFGRERGNGTRLPRLNF
jgi:hypothetical protein